MRQCNFCREDYRVYDFDAGTYLEQFCSNKCATDAEREIDAAVRFLIGDFPIVQDSVCERLVK